MNAAFIAIGMEADVFVFDRNRSTACASSTSRFDGRCSTVYSSTLAIEEMLPRADLVIGAVLIHGARAPRVITREQLALMKQRRGARRRVDRPGRLLRDLAPDDAPRPDLRGRRRSSTTASTNMPGAVPITSTYALTNATLPYVLALADHGVERRDRARPGPAAGRQRRRRPGHPPGRRRGRRDAVHAR